MRQKTELKPKATLNIYIYIYIQITGTIFAKALKMIGFVGHNISMYKE